MKNLQGELEAQLGDGHRAVPVRSLLCHQFSAGLLGRDFIATCANVLAYSIRLVIFLS